jgi:hypothetical protein
MDTIPLHIGIIFILTTVVTVWLFYSASGKSSKALFVLLGWLALQTALGLCGFYLKTDGIPPRFALLLLPPAALIILLFLLPSGRRFIDQFDLRLLTLLHVVRIPVEIVLLLLALHGAVPLLMTFEGRNFDILSGISALLLVLFAFKGKPNRTLLIVWNLACLGLLVNIVTIAILSAPFEFQRFAFDRPNIGLAYFPFVWLPCCVVPLVLFSHLAALRKLFTRS